MSEEKRSLSPKQVMDKLHPFHLWNTINAFFSDIQCLFVAYKYILTSALMQCVNSQRKRHTSDWYAKELLMSFHESNCPFYCIRYCSAYAFNSLFIDIWFLWRYSQNRHLNPPTDQTYLANWNNEKPLLWESERAKSSLSEARKSTLKMFKNPIIHFSNAKKR